MKNRNIKNAKKRLSMYDKAWKLPVFDIKIRDQVSRYALTLFK